MTQEDWDFYVDNDCSTGEHGMARVGFHDILVEFANYMAAGENSQALHDEQTSTTGGTPTLIHAAIYLECCSRPSGIHGETSVSR